MNKHIAKSLTLTALLLTSFGAHASWLCASVGQFDPTGFPVQPEIIIYRLDSFVYEADPSKCVKENTKEETKYFGLYKRELVVIALSIGIAFAIDKYRIKIDKNSIKVSVPIK